MTRVLLAAPLLRHGLLHLVQNKITDGVSFWGTFFVVKISQVIKNNQLKSLCSTYMHDCNLKNRFCEIN